MGRRSDLALYGILIRWGHVIAGCLAILSLNIDFWSCVSWSFSLMTSMFSVTYLNHAQSIRMVPRQTFPNRNSHSHTSFERNASTKPFNGFQLRSHDRHSITVVNVWISENPWMLHGSKTQNCEAIDPQQWRGPFRMILSTRYSVSPEMAGEVKRPLQKMAQSSRRWRRNNEPAHWTLLLSLVPWQGSLILGPKSFPAAKLGALAKTLKGRTYSLRYQTDKSRIFAVKRKRKGWQKAQKAGEKRKKERKRSTAKVIPPAH